MTGPSYLPEDLDEDRCGALGPTLEDGTVLLCARHEHPETVSHRLQVADVGDRKWARAYQPVHEDDQLVRTERPQGLPGPTPQGTIGASDNGHHEPAWDPQQQLKLRREAKARLEARNQEARAQLAEKTPQDRAKHHAHLDRPGAVAAAIGAPWCADVELDHLPHHTHLAWWVAAGVVQDDDVIHVCHEPQAHRDDIPRGDQGHRCVCLCGRVTRGTVGAGFAPTQRPEKKLDTGEDP